MGTQICVFTVGMLHVQVIAVHFARAHHFLSVIPRIEMCAITFSTTTGMAIIAETKGGLIDRLRNGAGAGSKVSGTVVGGADYIRAGREGSGTVTRRAVG